MTHTIYRTKRSCNFTTVANEWIHNPGLSAKAKGILLYLLSKPDDWTTRLEDIVSHMADGIDSIKSGLKELQKARHLLKKPQRDRAGKIVGWETLVFERPLPEVENPHLDETPTESPEEGFTRSGKSTMWENHNVENPLLLNTDLKLNTDLTKKEKECGVCTPPAQITESGGKRKAPKGGRQKASEVYESLCDRAGFEAFWKWYREQVCSIAGSAEGDKAKAAMRWRELEQSDFHGIGLLNFKRACKLYKERAIATKGIGTQHAERFLSGGELGEPRWLVLFQEHNIEPSVNFLEGVCNEDDLQDLQRAIAVELQRLGVSGAILREWRIQSGCKDSLASDLGIADAKAYLKYLRGLQHAPVAG